MAIGHSRVGNVFVTHAGRGLNETGIFTPLTLRFSYHGPNKSGERVKQGLLAYPTRAYNIISGSGNKNIA